MSQLSIDNALNVLGLAAIPSELPALDAAYQRALTSYQAVQGSQSEPLSLLLKLAYLRLKNVSAEARNSVASDPGYAERLAQALSYVAKTFLSFELLGAWLWVPAPVGSSALLESELRNHGFEWASKKACWFLKPQSTVICPKPDAQRETWDLDRIRAAYAPAYPRSRSSRGAASCL